MFHFFVGEETVKLILSSIKIYKCISVKNQFNYKISSYRICHELFVGTYNFQVPYNINVLT